MLLLRNKGLIDWLIDRPFLRSVRVHKFKMEDGKNSYFVGNNYFRRLAILSADATECIVYILLQRGAAVASKTDRRHGRNA